MTCVLSITHLYQNPCSGYSEDKSELNHKKCENFDFNNWIPAQHSSSGIGDTSSRCSTSCRVEVSSGPGSGSRVESSMPRGSSAGALSGHCNKHEPVVDTIADEQDVSRQKIDRPSDTVTKSANIDGLNADNCRRQSNIKQLGVSTYNHEHNDSRMQLGIKRKADTFDTDHVPTKRVSPFLNTPKERKDERKKVLKISLKKLRQLEDPETFLRRTVLVNNTMKRMQSELREEKYRSRKLESNRRKSFNGYNVLNNNCLSNSYLYDDPFLCGINEKITDDMTETLIKNVFHDKPCDVSALPEATDDNTSKQSAEQCSEESNMRTCNEHMVQSDRCEHLINSDSCKQCNSADVKCNQSTDIVEPMDVLASSSSTSTIISTQNGENAKSEIGETKCSNTSSTTECDNSLPVYDIHAPGGGIHVDIHVESTIEHNVQSSDVSVNKDAESVGEDLTNVDISDLDVITDSSYEMQSVLYLDTKLDQKSVSHSLNMFLSTFDINHTHTSLLS